MRRKNNPVIALILGIVFIAVAVLLIVFIPHEEYFVLAISADVLSGAVGVVFIVMSIVGFTKLSGKAKRVADPRTLAGQTYGKAGNYARFRAIRDIDRQDSANRTDNVIGAVVVATGGFAVFGKRYDYTDVFVSPVEVILNDTDTNIGLEEKKFTRVPLARVFEISAYSNKYVNIQIVCAEETYNLAIVNCSWTNEQICNFFYSLIPAARQQQQAMPQSSQSFNR